MKWLDYLRGGLYGVAVVTGVGVMAWAESNAGQSVERMKIETEKSGKLVNSVMLQASGYDRILSLQEKRNLLDRLGFEDSILQDTQDIYFRPNNKFKAGPGIDIVLGYNLENNGGFLKGSNANSGTCIGTLTRDQLEYRSSQQK